MNKNSSKYGDVRNKRLSHGILMSCILLITLFSCGKKASIESFDSKKWIEDKFACSGFRKAEAEKVLKNRKSLQGVSERNLKELLGSPDYQVVYKRNVKNLVYYTEPGSQCSEKEGNKGARLIIELNALGNVTWINEEHI